jgi:alpha-beta hydrolase superfamily lysophospholipase
MNVSRRTYRESTTWRSYLRFFPEAVRARTEDLVEEWWSWRGMTIHVDRLPSPEARLKVVLVHGAGAYGRVIAPWGARLHAEVVAPDLPGYGLSESDGRAVGYEDWVDVVADLVEREIERDGRPVVLFGGSLGGLLAYDVACRGRVRGLIATCLLDPRRPAVRDAIVRYRWLGALGVPLFLRFGRRFDSVRVPVRWLTKMSKMARDPDLGALCARDPLGGGGLVSLRWVRTFLSHVPRVEPEAFEACPVLMVHPGADEWTPLGVSRPFYDRLRADKELVVLEGAGHFPIEATAVDALERAVTTFLARVEEREGLSGRPDNAFARTSSP